MADVATEHSGAPVSSGAPGELRRVRAQLNAEVLDGRLEPALYPRRWAAGADAWLAARFEIAVAGHPKGFALVAVGGHGRGELCPGSDFDLVLLHRGRRHFERVAESIWYATWDEAVHLDHSVRTRREALSLCRAELKVVLGLLDGRVVAGDPTVATPVLEGAREILEHDASSLVRQLESALEERHRGAGELAYLLEPDLKQSAGGLRDVAALRALGVAFPQLRRFSEMSAFLDAERLVTSVRCVMQARSGSTGDRLLLQDQDQVAEILGYSDADALMAALAEAGRLIAARCADGWRRARALLRAPGESRVTVTLAPGIIQRDGEVTLAPEADPRARPELVVELALAAAQHNSLIDPDSLDRLAREATPLPRPWPPRVREAFLSLLGTGDALVPVVEALDQRRLFELLIPEWRAVRNKPQRNAFHRFTVDRHLLEAVARAGEHLDEVERPDLLLLCALLHDLGKGFPGDHSEVGRELAEQICQRMGLAPADIATVAAVVAYHLVLAEFATRRDLDDPSTAAVVAKLLENRLVLHLLAALTEADSRATGSAAWGPWKAELVQRLVERVEEVFDGRPRAAPTPPTPSPELIELLDGGRLAVRARGRKVTVVAPDRAGLLAQVTGVLALRGCNVRRASAYEGAPGMAVEEFDVDPVFEELPSWDRVEADLAAVLEGQMDLGARLAAQEQVYARRRRPLAARPATVRVQVDNTTSSLATILEVRAPDRVGLLHHVTSCLAEAELNVVAALVDTLGHEVIDTFYVRDRSGNKVTEPTFLAALRTRLAEMASAH